MRSRGIRQRRFRPVPFALAAACLLVLGLLPIASAQGSGVGVAPSTLRIDDPPLVRGGTMERTLSFQQHDYDTAEVEIRVLPPTDGSTDGSSWVTVDPTGTLTVPRTSDYPIEVTIKVPAAASNGEYRAKVEFRVLQACDSGGSCAAVQTAASSILVMTVSGEQVKRIKVTGSPVVRDAEEGGALQFTLPFENIGNVVADPHVRLDVQDKHQTRTLRTYWFNDTALRPGETGPKTFIRQGIELTPDQYWANVAVYLDGVLVHEANPQTFDVLEPGALARNAVLKTIRIDGDLVQAKVGDLIKLNALVENTGQAPVVATFKGEVWIDGALRDTFESDPLEVPVGESGTIGLIYTVKEAGQHEFKGRVHYGSKVTQERTLLLRVEGAAGGVGPVLAWVGGAVVFVLAGVLIAVAVSKGRRKQAGPPRGSRRGAPRGRPPQKRPPGSSRPPAQGSPRRGPPPQGRPAQRPPGPPRRPPGGGGAPPGRPPARGPPPRR